MINLMNVLIGFFSKQFVLYSALQNGYYFISLIAIIVSVISASYYLKIIKVLHTDHDYFEDKLLQEAVEENKAPNKSKTTLTNTHSFLISSLTLIILLFFIKPSIILNSTQLLSLCAPYEGFCCLGFCLIPLVYLTVNKFNDTSCWYSRLFKLITFLVWIAEYKCDKWLGLPSRETFVSRNSQVEDNKPDTYQRL